MSKKPNWKERGLALFSLVVLVGASALLLVSLEPDEPSRNDRGAPGKLLGAVSGDSILAHIRTLASRNSRYGDTKGSRFTIEYIRKKLAAAGWNVRFDVTRYRAPGKGYGNVRNVIALPERTEGDNAVLAFCAHYDSKSDRGATAPGADDNASGVAVLLEVARVLGGQARGNGMHLELWFLGGEEDSLRGSRAKAERLKRSPVRVYGIVNVDMVGYDAEGPKDFVVFTNGPSLDLASRMMRCASLYTSLVCDTTLTDRGDSDHAPFWEIGLEAISIWEGYDHNPYYHTPEDTPEKLSARFMEEITKAILCLYKELATLPAGG